MIKAKFTVLLAFAVIAGCTPAEPPGPAERIGKSIDQLTKDITEIAKEMDKEQEESGFKQTELRKGLPTSTPTPVQNQVYPGTRQPFDSRREPEYR